MLFRHFCHIGFANGFRLIAPLRANVSDHVGNVFVAERPFPGRHLTIVVRAVDFEFTL